MQRAAKTLPGLVRPLRRRGALPTVVVLALGIALATGLYSVLDGALLRGLPGPDGDRIVTVATHRGYDRPVPVEDFRALRERHEGFEEVAAFRTYNAVLTGEGSGSRGLTATYVSGDLFSLLGAEPALGRGFSLQDEDPEAPPVAMLSHRVWQTQFGGDETVIGQQAILNRERMTIIGVMPSGFRFPIRQEAWAAIRWQGRLWSQAPVFVVGKLAAGSGPESAEAWLASVVAGLDAERPLDEPRQAHVRRYTSAILPATVQRSLWVMLWAALAVLLVACVNAASLRLADALGRSDELRVRRALGAGRRRLLGQLVSETAVVAAVGSAAGAALAWLLVELVSRRLLHGSSLVRFFWIDVRLDGRSLLFAVGLTAVTVLVAGLVPALWSLRRDNLRLSARATDGRATVRLAQSLVGAQVGLCFCLVLGAALLLRSGAALLAAEPGFDPRHLVRSLLNTYQAEHETAEVRQDFLRRLVSRLEAEPEIESATLASAVPWSTRGQSFRLRLEGEATDVDRLPQAHSAQVIPGYFETLRLPVLAGRTFDRSDLQMAEARDDAPAIVSAGLAERMFAGKAIGRRLELFGRSHVEPFLHVEVVGVVADRDPAGVESDTAVGEIYLPYSLARGVGGFLVVRGRSGTTGFESTLERVVREVDPLVATLDTYTFEEERAEQTWIERRLAQIFALFAVATLTASAVGLYGALRLALSRRRRELAIRSALGAPPRDLHHRLLGEAGRCFALGIVLGGLLALQMGRALEPFLYRLRWWDPNTSAVVLAVVFAVLLLASLGSAWRAARTDPADVLRGE